MGKRGGSRDPRKVNTSHWQRIRAGVLAEEGWTCRYCGGFANTVDHVIPRRDGGTHERSNLVAACWTCQKVKEFPDRVLEVAARFSAGRRADAPSLIRISARNTPEEAQITPIRGDYTAK